MSNRFWFGWDLCFAVVCAALTVVVFTTDAGLLTRIWYPVATVLFASMAYIMWKVDQDDYTA